MRKAYWIILTVLLVAASAPDAHPDSCPPGNNCTDFTISFTVDPTQSNVSAAPTGSFVYDNSTNLFTSFTVEWDGNTFDLTSGAFGANSPIYGSLGAGPLSCLGGATGPAASLALLAACPDATTTTQAQTTEWSGSGCSGSSMHGVCLGPTTPIFAFGTELDSAPGKTNFGFAEVAPTASLSPDDYAAGAFSIVQTPEPGTVGLLLTGIGGLLMRRNRSAQRHRQST